MHARLEGTKESCTDAYGHLSAVARHAYRVHAMHAVDSWHAAVSLPASLPLGASLGARAEAAKWQGMHTGLHAMRAVDSRHAAILQPASSPWGASLGAREEAARPGGLACQARCLTAARGCAGGPALGHEHEPELELGCLQKAWCTWAAPAPRTKPAQGAALPNALGHGIGANECRCVSLPCARGKPASVPVASAASGPGWHSDVYLDIDSSDTVRRLASSLVVKHTGHSHEHLLPTGGLMLVHNPHPPMRLTDSAQGQMQGHNLPQTRHTPSMHAM